MWWCGLIHSLLRHNRTVLQIHTYTLPHHITTLHHSKSHHTAPQMWWVGGVGWLDYVMWFTDAMICAVCCNVKMCCCCDVGWCDVMICWCDVILCGVAFSRWWWWSNVMQWCDVMMWSMWWWCDVVMCHTISFLNSKFHYNLLVVFFNFMWVKLIICI